MMYLRTRDLGIGDRRRAIHGRWQAGHTPEAYLVATHERGKRNAHLRARRIASRIGICPTHCKLSDRWLPVSHPKMQ